MREAPIRGAVALRVVFFLAVVVALCACSPPNTARPRAILIGIDGATRRVAGRLMDEGRMPHLDRIRREGVSGQIRSEKPLVSPRIWNTVSTGKSPDRHGILSFAYQDPQGAQRLYLSSDRRVHSVWNIASDAGLTVSVVNWWNTQPPEKINGVMVSDHLLAKEVEKLRDMTHAVEAPQGGPVVYPVEWQSRLEALLAKGVLPIAFDDPFAGNSGLPRWARPQRLSRWFLQDGAVANAAIEIGGAVRPDLSLVLLTAIDRVSHTLWGTLEPPELYPPELRPSDEERREGARALERVYEFTDALIGKLTESYAPEDLVVVMSDHGFEAGVDLGDLTGIHNSPQALDGVFFARGRGIPAGEPAGEISIYDVTPTILAWLGLPVASDMGGRAAGFALERVPRVETYDTKPIERLGDEASGADETLMEQLRSLGYVE